MTYLAVSGLSHVGLVRDSNEDSLLVGPWTLCGAQTGTPQTLAFPGPCCVERARASVGC
jgi:hypothetical protein